MTRKRATNRRATPAQHMIAIPLITAAKQELSPKEFENACRAAGYADGVGVWQVVESRLPGNRYAKTHYLSSRRFRALVESLRRALRDSRDRQPQLALDDPHRPLWRSRREAVAEPLRAALRELEVILGEGEHAPFERPGLASMSDGIRDFIRRLES